MPGRLRLQYLGRRCDQTRARGRAGVSGSIRGRAGTCEPSQTLRIASWVGTLRLSPQRPPLSPAARLCRGCSDLCGFGFVRSVPRRGCNNLCVFQQSQGAAAIRLAAKAQDSADLNYPSVLLRGIGCLESRKSLHLRQGERVSTPNPYKSLHLRRGRLVGTPGSGGKLREASWLEPGSTGF